MTGDYVAVLRNMRCGHVVAIVPEAHAKRLYRQLRQIDQGGWMVTIVSNTNDVYDSFLEAPCPTCRLT